MQPLNKSLLARLIKKLPTRANALAEICAGEPIFINPQDYKPSRTGQPEQSAATAPEIVIGSYNWHAVFTAAMRKHALPNFNADANQVTQTLAKWYTKHAAYSVEHNLFDVQLLIASMPLKEAIKLYTDYYQLPTYVDNGKGQLVKAELANKDIQRCANVINKELSLPRISSFAVPNLEP